MSFTLTDADTAAMLAMRLSSEQLLEALRREHPHIIRHLTRHMRGTN